MGRPPVFSAETKTRIVLSVLSGEISVAEAARKEKVSEQSIGRWKAEFLEAGYLENCCRTGARPGLVQVSGVDALTSGCPRLRVALIWSAPPRTPPGQEWLKRGLNVRK